MSSTRTAHRRRLVGAPGTVGTARRPAFTEAVRRKPYSVVLFDEVEKAHPDVFNTLLQVLDNGRLADAQVRTVNFRNTVIIMTSNIGSRYLTADATADGEIKPTPASACWARCALLPAQFLNRLDDIVLFKPLTPAEIEHIVEAHAGRRPPRLADRQMQLEVSESAKHFIHRRAGLSDPATGRGRCAVSSPGGRDPDPPRPLLIAGMHDGAVIRVNYIRGELAVGYEALQTG